VALWRDEREGGYFDLPGTHLYVSLEDIYFLKGLMMTRLPTMGLIESPHLILSRGYSKEELVVLHYTKRVGRINNGMILISGMWEPLMRVA